jgi:hypothetical protein
MADELSAGFVVFDGFDATGPDGPAVPHAAMTVNAAAVVNARASLTMER